MYSITEFKTKVFVLSVKVLLQYRNKWVNTSSFMDRRFVLTIRTFWKRDFLSSIDLQSKPMDWFLHDWTSVMIELKETITTSKIREIRGTMVDLNKKFILKT